MENTEEINFKTQENTSKIPQSLLSEEEKAKKRHEGFKKFEKAAISEENIKKANDIMLEQSKLFGALQELVRDDMITDINCNSHAIWVDHIKMDVMKLKILKWIMMT